MAEAIVLYPTPAIGHLISMVVLAKLILTHHPSLTVHILMDYWVPLVRYEGSDGS
jgi:hypothetical protein